MIIKKRTKNSRQRAGTTHGWGSMKKHRGAGNRGGVGNAGSGKRGDSKKPSFWKKKKFGMHGFKKKGICIKIHSINLSGLSKYGKLELSLADYGINKLLGKGKIDKAYNITVNYASKNAIAKIEKAKGKVNLLKLKSLEAEDSAAE